jgi:hypothetical protein
MNVPELSKATNGVKKQPAVISELRIIEACILALNELTDSQKSRVVKYLAEIYVLDPIRGNIENMLKGKREE